jgi:hypothetical protein
MKLGSEMKAGSVGKVVRYLGWVGIVYFGIKYTYGFFSTLADPSVSVYAPLIVFEGLLFLLPAALLIWIGRRLERRAKAGSSEQPGEKGIQA